mgnify:CR=1 FL=1
MASASYTLEVDWDNTWSIGAAAAFTHAQANITNDIITLHCRRGLAAGASLFHQLQSGQLTVELNNKTGKYSPNNTGSVLTGLIQPGHWVRLRTTAVDGGAYARTLWGGRLLNIKALGKAKNKVSYAVLTAIGDLGWHAKRVIQQMPKATLLSGSVFTKTMTAITGRTTFTNHTIDAGLFAFDVYTGEGKNGYDALYEICVAEAGRLYEDTEGKMGFKQRHARLQDTKSVTAQATLSDAAGAAFSYDSIKQVDSSEVGMIYNEVAADYQKRTAQAQATLWTLATTPSLLPGESKTFWAIYPNLASPTNAVQVNAWLTLVATTDYLANSAANGSGVDYTADIGVVLTKSTGYMQITLTNNAAVEIYITLLQARGTPLTEDDAVRFVVEDTTSQAAYGDRRYPIVPILSPSLAPGAAGDVGTLDWARFHLAMYKDKFQMFDCEVMGNRSTATLQNLANLDLDNRVTVVANGDSQLGISSLDCFIEAIEHKIDKAKNHRTRYILSETTPTGGWWTWGYAMWGTTTRFAY